MAREFDVEVTTRGDLTDAAEHARRKIGGLGRFAHRPVLHARVKLTELADPAVPRPVLAQANLDVSGRLVRAQAYGATATEAIDLLEDRLRTGLERAAGRRAGQRKRMNPVAARIAGTEIPGQERRIVRHKSFSAAPCSVDDAVAEMDLLDYDFHLFTESGTSMASVLYRGGPTGFRLAQVAPCRADQLAPFELPLTISPQPPPCITVAQAVERLGVLGLPFLFFIDAEQGRASVLYQRYAGHYGLITPSG